MNILFLDPDEYYHRKFEEHMSTLGNLLIKSETGELKKIIKEFQPHVLVSELLVKDKTLYEILEEIKSEIRERNFPVFVYSKIDNLEDLGKALEYGVSGYLVKGQSSLDNLKNLILNLKAYA